MHCIAYILGVSSLKLMEAFRNVSRVEKYSPVSEGLREVTEERNGEEQKVLGRSCVCAYVKLFDINYKKVIILLLSHLAVISIDIAKLNFTYARVIKGNGLVSYVKRITQ